MAKTAHVMSAKVAVKRFLGLVQDYMRNETNSYGSID